MGQFFDEIPSWLFPWIEEQEVFWVASAPLSPDGHVNISPKGLRGTFRIITPNKVFYQDISGSGGLSALSTRNRWTGVVNLLIRPGIETISHLKENGRITIMLSAFQGPPEDNEVVWEGYATSELDCHHALRLNLHTHISKERCMNLGHPSMTHSYLSTIVNRVLAVRLSSKFTKLAQ